MAHASTERDGWSTRRRARRICRSTLKRSGADFVAFSAHKMLGPTGVGVLWARRGLLEDDGPIPGWRRHDRAGRRG